MNTLDFFRSSCFPNGPSSNIDPSTIVNNNPISQVFNRFIALIKRKSTTQPRETAFNNRHPSNQGGMVVDESGNVEIRSGHELYDHAIGASLSLMNSGHIAITSPAGIAYSGGSIYLTGKPSDMFKFVGGQFQFNPDWEEERIICSPKYLTMLSGDINKLLIMKDNGSDDPDIVKLTDYFDMSPLYTLIQQGNIV